MKKKLLIIFVAVITILSACAALSACETAPAGTTPSPTLKTGVKYYYSSYVRDENYDEYYIFNADGTAVYRMYQINEEEIYKYSDKDYTIKFKYAFADETALVCFYDSIEYGDKHRSTEEISTSTTHLLTVSENIVIRTGYYGNYIFVNENYLKTLTNFDKRSV